MYQYEKERFFDLLRNYAKSIQRRIPEDMVLNIYFEKLSDRYEFYEINQAFEWMTFNREDKSFPNIAEIVEAIEEVTFGSKTKEGECPYCGGMGMVLIPVRELDGYEHDKAWRCDCQIGERMSKQMKSIKEHPAFPEILQVIKKTATEILKEKEGAKQDEPTI